MDRSGAARRRHRFRCLAGRARVRRERQSRTGARQRAAGQRRAAAGRYRRRIAASPTMRTSHAQSARDATHSVPWNIVSVDPVAGQSVQDRSADIRRRAGSGRRRVEAVRRRRRLRSRPTSCMGTVASTFRRCATKSRSWHELPQDAARLDADAPGDLGSRVPLAAARRPFTTARPDIGPRQPPGEHRARRTARAVDDGRRRPAHLLHGFPDQRRSARHRWPARRFRNPPVRQRQARRGRPRDRTPNSTEAVAPIDLGPEFDQQYGFTNPTTDFRNSNQSSHFPICRTDLEVDVGPDRPG